MAKSKSAAKSKATNKAKSKPSYNTSSKLLNMPKSRSEKVYHSKKKTKQFDYISSLNHLKLRLKKVNSRLFVYAALFLAFVIFSYYTVNLYLEDKANKAFYEQIRDQTDLELAEITAKKNLIGNKDQLANEIVNFQSAPKDLQDWVLRDYYVFKSRCIVNGAYVGPASYKITNVTYDNYAKLTMKCAGEDQQIVAKVGGQWTVVSAGKGAPDCNDVNSLAIPMGIAPTCTDGKILYPNPNP